MTEVLDQALVDAYEAIWRRDGSGTMAALEPFLHDPTTICELAQLLAEGISGAIKRTGTKAHVFELEGLSDNAAHTITALVVAVGNGDHDGACHLVHRCSPDETSEVIAGLVHMVATIAEPNS